jgi:GDSL-like lipase/acylhydrolase family protein
MNAPFASTRRQLVAISLLALTACFAAAQDTPRVAPLRPDDVVVFVGGENVVESLRDGYAELLLTWQHSSGVPRFRYLCWEGDTVFEQRRDLNFGSWTDQLQRVGATVVVAQFGQSEMLGGPVDLPRFVAAYEALLDQFAAPGRRIVLVSPTPFEIGGGSLPDLVPRNADLQACVEAIRSLAAKRGLGFVDLFTRLRNSKNRLTRDGLHLTAFGQWIAANRLAVEFGNGHRPGWTFNIRTGAVELEPAEKLRGVIVAKNRLWFDYWRPMNWAFLNGDRTSQPSSRDHRDPSVRWFPKEMETFLPLIRAKEEEIARLVTEAK